MLSSGPKADAILDADRDHRVFSAAVLAIHRRSAFRPMAITLCFALLGALLIALYLVPVLSTFLFKKASRVQEKDIFDRLTDEYRDSSSSVLRRRKKPLSRAAGYSCDGRLFCSSSARHGISALYGRGSFLDSRQFSGRNLLKENSQYGNQLR